MAALFSTDHWPQLLLRAECVAVGAMAKPKERHLMLWQTPLLAITALVVSLYGTIKNDNSSSWQRQRAQLLKQLKQEDGKHLIVASYGLGHSVHNEWVYNDVDIDRDKMIFARAINSPQDCGS